MAAEGKPTAFYHDRFLDADEVAIRYWDLSFAQGAGVSEHLRTFRGRLPLWDRHAVRFRHGLALLGIDLGEPGDHLRSIVERLVEDNRGTAPPRGTWGSVCMARRECRRRGFRPHPIAAAAANRVCWPTRIPCRWPPGPRRRAAGPGCKR